MMKRSGLIPSEKIIERLQYENPWWTSHQILDTYENMPRRLYFEWFYPFVADLKLRRAIVLMGPRRVGKTVLMYHTIARLISEGVSAEKLFFVGIDNPIYINLSLQDILDICQKAVNGTDFKGCYVFFDEIQYLKDWERHLKILVDSYPETKFVVSGSAAAALKWHSTESGAGRFTDFMLPPLTFEEFIHLKGESHLLQQQTITYAGAALPYWTTPHIGALNQLFVQYLNFGGYPEVVFSEKIQQDMGRYIKNDIVDKVLLRDLPSLYGIKDVQELNRFFSYIAYNTGNEFSYEKIAKESGISKETLKKYLEYLEAAFLIKVLNKVDITAKKLKRVTSFKIYLTNPSLRTALFSPIKEDDEEMGNMVETAILSQWMHHERMHLTYARWKEGRGEGEVDLVRIDPQHFKPQWALEIKWSNRYYQMPQDLTSLMSFCKANALKSAFVTTKDTIGTKPLEDMSFTFVPSALYAYNVGQLAH